MSNTDPLALASERPVTSYAPTIERRRRHKRGYTHTHLPIEIVQLLKEYERTNLWASIGVACGYLATIVGAAITTMSAWHQAPVLGVAAYVVSLIFVARQLRGLELMVHDASHMSWCRSNGRANDRIADVVVAYALMGTVAAYRKSHFIHHREYAGDLDPCRQRFARMGLGDLDLSTKWSIAIAVIRWLPRYNLEYYAEIGSKSAGTLVRWGIWHVCLLIFPLSILVGLWPAILVWVLFWVIPMAMTLPVLRSIAEAEEHDYGKNSTEFDSTFTNDGFVHHLLWHPWNDAYHQVHHMYPNISQRHHHKVHALLMKHDTRYRNSRIRTKTLERVE